MRRVSDSVTIREVAQAAGVSIATVSRVLNENCVVTPATKERVLKAMERLGYNRNEVARSLKIRQTRTIGIIAPEIYNNFFMEILVVIEQLLAKKGYTVVIASSNDSLEDEKRNLQVFIERNVDGLIIIPASLEHAHFKTKALHNTPMIILDRKLDGLEADTVTVDNRYGVRSMVKALIDEGFTRIGYIGGPPSFYTAKERLQGFCETMEEFNLEVEERFLLYDKGMNLATGKKLLKKALSFRDHPKAFFIANDSLHLGATIYAAENKVKDLTFASFDYLSYAPLLTFCHYAVAQPLEQMGSEVVSLLLRRISGDWGNFPANVILPPEVKVMNNR
ncbi:MAG: LacI family DNA-binding transcriptional regulator [Sphaerochaetaceae bacterium]